MQTTLRSNRWRSLIGVAGIVLGAVIVYGDEKPVDVTKRRAETNTERLIAGVRPPAAEQQKPVSKGFIEASTEAVVARSAVPTGEARFINPKVEPGKVSWHPSFEAACAAAKRSGKPVLLFQMMGKLDDQFC